jgi:hypothetical protein
MPDSQDELRREIKADEYARACEEWMLKIRQIAAESYTGNIFKGAVETGLGTLARDAENQIVVVSANKQFTTVVDRGLKGTFDPIEFQRWVSSVDRTKLPTRYEVREGWDHAADPPLAGLLKHLDERQAADSAALTKKRDQQMDALQFKDPKQFLVHMQYRREQSAAFEAERNRYIEEHRAAERVREELRQREFERAAQPEKFKSKFYEP